MLNSAALSLLFACTLLGTAVAADLLVLQRQWQPTACSDGSNCTPDYKDAFVIQRLYQASDTSAAPQTGCTGGGGLRRNDLDASDLDEAELECAYYNATVGLTSQLTGWRDMWNEFGRCTGAGDALSYLALGLDLDLAYPLPLDLPAQVNGDALAAAIQAAFGAAPQLTCTGGKLEAVSLCFPADAFDSEGTTKPVDCPWAADAACRDGLQVPRGQQGVGADCAAYIQQSPVNVNGLAAAAPAPAPAAAQPAPAPAPAAGQPAAATPAPAPSLAQQAAAAGPSPATAPEPAVAGQQAASGGSAADTSGSSAGATSAASSAQLSGSTATADTSAEGGSSSTSTTAMVGALVGGVVGGVVAGLAAFGGGYWWWTRRRRTAPAAASPSKSSEDDAEKGLAVARQARQASSLPSSDSWSDGGSASGNGTKRTDSRSSRGASMPPSPCLPRRAGTMQPSPPRPASSGSGGSGGSPPGSTGGYGRSPSAGARGGLGLRAYPPVGAATGKHSTGRTSVDNPQWLPPASPGGMSPRSLAGGWTATDTPLQTDGSEGGASSSGQGRLMRSTSNASSGGSRRLPRAEGAGASGRVPAHPEGSPASGRVPAHPEGSPASGRLLLRSSTDVVTPVGPLARTASGTSQPRTPHSPVVSRSLPRTPTGQSMGSARQLARSGGSMGSGEVLPEGGVNGGLASTLATSGSKFAQRPPARGKYVPAPARALKYAQPAGRTPASASTKSFNARTAPPQEALQRQPSKLDRLLSHGRGAPAQASGAAAGGSTADFTSEITPFESTGGSL